MNNQIIGDVTYINSEIIFKGNNNILVCKGKLQLENCKIRFTGNNSLIYIDENNLSIEKLKYFDIVYDVPIYDTKYQNTMTNYPVTPFKINYIYFEKWVTDNKENILKKWKY